MEKIKVAVVDDSGFMRLVLTDIVNSDPLLHVVKTGNNGLEAVDIVRTMKPDVLVLDMVMGEYDGRYAIKNIMESYPMPIIVVSGMNDNDQETIGEILELGAFDFVSKPTKNKQNIRDLQYILPSRIKSAKTGFRKQRDVGSYVNHNPHTFSEELHYDAIVVGASTGGPSTVEKFLLQLPSNLPIPIIIAQHMPANFLPSYAERLNKICPIPVSLGRDGQLIKPGCVYILSGEANHLLEKEGRNVVIRRTEHKYRAFNNPSVDALFTSASAIYRRKLLGIVLTGMGFDGREGVIQVKKNGGLCIAQDEKTSVVDGMPREAAGTGKVDHILPITDMGGFVVSCLS